MFPDVKVKLLRPGAHMPEYAHDGDSGLDVRCIEGFRVEYGSVVKVPLGFAWQIPYGLEGQLRPRSSQSLVGMHVFLGTCDSPYRGELSAVLTMLWPFCPDGTANTWTYGPGDKIGQLVVAPVAKAKLVLALELEPSPRGANGWGSTDRKVM